MSLALVTAAAARDLDDDLPPLSAALSRRGVDHEVIVWDEPGRDWSAFDLTVVKSTWDYPSRRTEFLAWAARPPRVMNPLEVLRWNTDKHYLAELAAAGVPVVPTVYLAPGDVVEWPAWPEVVVKPVVSAGALDTARHGSRPEAEAHAGRLLANGRAVMVQPYLASVEEHGETAVVFLGGEMSHAIRKGPLLGGEQTVVAGLFTKEDIAPRTPGAAEVAVAAAALAAIPTPEPLLFGRVDVVAGADGPLVLEIEATEPSLFLDYGEGAADRLALLISRILGQ